MIFDKELTLAALVDVVHTRLNAAYPGNYHHNNKNTIFNELLFIFLSWRTPIEKAQKIYQMIISNIGNTNELFDWTPEQWFKVLLTGGKAHDKSQTIFKLMQQVRLDFQDTSTFENHLWNLTESAVFQYLTSLPGIKEKSAYCIMLYAMKMPVFPADAHCLRISNRLGLIQIEMSKKQDRVKGQQQLQSIIGGNFEWCYDIHTKMIVHGQQICGYKPKCKTCCLNQVCEYFLR